MLRTFREHTIRNLKSLDCRWDFVTQADVPHNLQIPANYNRTIQVPSAWQNLPGLENFRGKAWFRQNIKLENPANIRLVFGGVSHTAKVFLDSKLCGSHYDAFTPWDVIIPELSAGNHEIVVEVDNSFGEHSALHIENDYYTYGGITRPVELQIIDDIFIDKIMLLPQKDRDKWHLSVEVRLKNIGPKKHTRKILIRMGENQLDLGTVSISPGTVQFVHGIIKNLAVDAWAPESPQLYSVAAELFKDNAVTDDMVDRIGFREIKISGKNLLLNGKKLRLGGFNRHEDHPQFGCALPLDAMANDLEIIRDLGCNFIRTSHYPNDMRFLDLCDEMGFCVWEESHARDVDFKHPMFEQQIKSSTEEMVTWHFNRPSIIIWGCLNECESQTQSGRRIYSDVISQIRNLDSSRPITYASFRGKDDICYDLADIVSLNFYIGWYKYNNIADGSDAALQHLEDILEWLNSDNSNGGKNKPVIMSEFGAGAIYGNRQPCRSKWSEERQADILAQQLQVYLNHPAICGAAIWQFCDCRISENWGWMSRPRCMNNKGVVDEYRRPKLSYETVKRHMHKAGIR